MNKILITNAFGPQNRGDHELLQKLIFILREKYGTECSIDVFTTYPEESKAVISGVVFHRSPFYRPVGFNSALLMAWDLIFWMAASVLHKGFRVFISSSRKILINKILNSNLIVMCPGGYLYSNGFSLYANLVNCIPFIKTKALKVAAPMSIGPFTSIVDSWASSIIIKSLDKVHTRESYSFDLVKKMGVNPVYTHDLAWYLGSEEVALDTSWAGHFVGTVIDWSYPGNNKSIDYRERYINEYICAASKLADISGNPFIIFNQVGSGDGTSKDEVLIKEIVDRSLGNIVFDSTGATPELLKSRLYGCKGIIASRFHSCLFAIQMDVPFISIAYQPKAEYILKDLGLSKFCRDITFFDGLEVADSLLEAIDSHGDVVGLISKAKERARANIENSFLVDE